MSLRTPDKETVDILLELGGEPLKICYQCGTCTGTCPWNLVRSFAVRRLMHRAQLGLVDFEDEDIWTCATCGACVKRCPRGVEIIDVMKAIRKVVTVKKRKVWSLKDARGKLEQLLQAAPQNWTVIDHYLVAYLTDPEERRTALAASFGASLEMVREGAVEIRQTGSFQPLFVRAVGDESGEGT